MKHINLLQHIGQSLNELRKSEKKVADYVLTNASEVILMRIVDLAQEAQVSEPTVVRFCRAIGCQSFQEFKLGLAQQLAVSPDIRRNEVQSNDNPIEYATKIFNTSIESLHRVRDTINSDDLDTAVETISQAKQIAFFGFGASAAVSMDAQHKFFRLGISTHTYSDPHIQHMAALGLKKRDVVVCISESGRTTALLNVAKLVQDQGALVISISPSGTPISNISDIALCVDIRNQNDAFAHQTSRIAHLLMIDTLAIGVAKRINNDANAYLQRLELGLQGLRT